MRFGKGAWLALLLVTAVSSLALIWPESPKYARWVEREPVPGERDPIEPAAPTAALLSAYRDARARYRDIGYPELVKELSIEDPAEPELGFDPEQALFFDRIAKELELDPGERELYRKNGFVSVDHQQRYSMGSAY